MTYTKRLSTIVIHRRRKYLVLAEPAIPPSSFSQLADSYPPSFVRVTMIPGTHSFTFPRGQQTNSISENKNDGERDRQGERERQTHVAAHFPRSHERAETARAEGKQPSCIPISTKQRIRKIFGANVTYPVSFLVNLLASSGISLLSLAGVLISLAIYKMKIVLGPIFRLLRSTLRTQCTESIKCNENAGKHFSSRQNLFQNLFYLQFISERFNRA